MRLVLGCSVWRTQAVIEVPSVVRFWGSEAAAVATEARRVQRQVLHTSIGKRSLMSIAAVIIPLAAILAPMAISLRDELFEDELIGTLPTSLPADSAVHTLAAVMDRPPAASAETLVQTSEAFRELIPSPRPRPVYKPRPRRVHKMRNAPNNALPILSLAGSTEVQPVRPLAALMNAPPAGDAETLVQSFVPSQEPSTLPIAPPADSTGALHTLAATTGGPPAAYDDNLVQSSEAFRKPIPSPRPRPVYKPHPRRVHKMRNVPNSIADRDAVAILKNLGDPSQIDKIVKDNPSNVFLLLMAEMRRASQETGHLIEKLIDGIEPPALAKEMNYASASSAELEAYRLDLKAAEANAMAAMPRYVTLLESERERVEVVVHSLNMDDRYIRAALSEIDKRRAQSRDITSKMLLANAELYRAIGRYVDILIEQFGHYKVSTNGRFMFSSQSVVDLYNEASRQVNDAIKRVAEVEEERKGLTRFQQEEWERFVSGK
jgi:hypothetical protein